MQSARSHGGFAQTSIEDMIREIARAAKRIADAAIDLARYVAP